MLYIYLLFVLLVSKFSLDFGSNTKINLCAVEGTQWLANDLYLEIKVVYASIHWLMS